MLVTPAKPVRDGEVFRTVVAYDGTPRTIKGEDGGLEGWIETDDGSTALGQPTGSMTWFPGNHHPSDKATYDITVTVPRDADGDFYDVVSNGELIREEAKGDTMTRHRRTEEPMAGYLAHVSVGYFETHKGRTHDHVPVYVAVDPDESRDATAVADLVPEIVDWAGGRFGPYPFSSTGAVVDHLPGLDYALETRKRGGRSTGEIFEGFYDGTDAESEGIWAFPPAAPPSAGRVSGPPVYGRGAMVVHKVREAVGDETFFGILRTWKRRHRHGNADTRQFVALCENESGKDLTGLFDTWLFGERKPSRR